MTSRAAIPRSSFHVPGLIGKKRDGHELDPAELDALLDGYLAGDVPEYQMSAFLMAVYFQGLSVAELDHWTAKLIASGERWDWSGIPGPKVDKHSTGGVGDSVSLVLAPLAAALGLKVPMVSGRGLGHTGGTLDKLESIPGLRTDLGREDFARVLEEVGFAMGGQTAAFAPLDGELYALRDVTATIESMPLIAASIVAKKIAEGLDALMLDVKTGPGAFLPEQDAGEHLARLMLDLAGRFGLRAEALVTGMDQPLGLAVGHALEVREALHVLRGEGPPDLRALTLDLTARLLVMVGEAPSESAARRRSEAALEDGSALERFRRWVTAQGGDARIVDEPERLPTAPVTAEARADGPGFVHRLDTRSVGLLVIELGGGRARKGDAVEHAVGIVFDRKLGDEVRRGDRLATVHAATAAAAESAAARLSDLYEIAEAPPELPPLVRKRLTS